METRTDTYVKYTNAPTSRRCVVFDMDDTLCHYDKELRLGHCDVFEAREQEHAAALSALEQGIDVVIATARPCWTAYRTKKWLRRHNIPVAALYLKNRQNWSVAAHDLKREMLTDIQKTYEIVSFHDDSPWTVAAAREMGVNAVFVPGNEDYWLSKGKEMGWDRLFQLGNCNT
jgi:FMN phosphatase YigB (HAD superfamily)